MKPPTKNKCELCKCLNLIVECKKHPSRSTWLTLLQKTEAIRNKEVTSTFCDTHRLPLHLIVDFKSVMGFIEQVDKAVHKLSGGV